MTLRDVDTVLTAAAVDPAVVTARRHLSAPGAQERIHQA